ncbi:MAG TPA: polysaccharide biosynthesis/export family protein [Azospirillum sp.]|nr:polysaccharide biosynthesis/export family protein [Azospirillum sp.]
MSSLSRGCGARAFVLSAVVAGFLAAGCSSTPGFPTEDAPMKISSPTDGYLLEPGNRVRLTVFGESSLSGDFTLDPAGNVALPLVGNVPASGVTAKTLAKRIEDLLKKDAYLQDPKAAIEVQTFRPFYVLGEVRAPGEFPYTSGMTVLSAVARAGGYDYRAREGEVVLVRVVDGDQKDYRAVERTPILPGDIVRVLQRRF